MKLTDHRLKTPPPLVMTPALARLVRLASMFNDDLVEALTDEFEKEAENESPHLRQQSKRQA